jgi:hypothetical protein
MRAMTANLRVLVISAPQILSIIGAIRDLYASIIVSKMPIKIAICISPVMTIAPRRNVTRAANSLVTQKRS